MKTDSTHNTLAMLSLVVGASAASMTSEGSLDLWDTILGIILLLVLLAYQDMDLQGWIQKAAYSSLLAFAGLLFAGGLLTTALYYLWEVDLDTENVTQIWTPLAWGVLCFPAYRYVELRQHHIKKESDRPE